VHTDLIYPFEVCLRVPPRPRRLHILFSQDLSLPLSSLRRVGVGHTIRFFRTPLQATCLQEPIEISMASPEFTLCILNYLYC
jgi:hypothetical protein